MKASFFYVFDLKYICNITIIGMTSHYVRIAIVRNRTLDLEKVIKCL